MSDFVTACGTFIIGLFTAFGRLIRKHSLVALGCLVVVALVTQAWTAYSTSFVKEITIYVGDPGTYSYRLGGYVADAIRDSSSTFMRFRTKIVPTQGSDDIEQRIAADSSGTAIGFIQDRSDQSSKISVLLPVGWDYLHVLCSRRFLAQLVDKHNFRERLQDRLKDSSAFHSSILLSEVAPHLDQMKPRVFLGSVDSAARRLSLHVLTQLGFKDPEQFATYGIHNLYDLRPALRGDHVDLAFYLGPLNSRLVHSIVADNSAVLLSLSDLHKAIAGQEAAWVVEIPENEYVGPARVPDDVPPDPKTLSGHDWADRLQVCPRSMHSLASRHVLTTSNEMLSTDAYAISKAAYEKLSSEGFVLEDPWKDVASSPEAPERNQPSKQMLRTHPGAIVSKDGSPGGWLHRYWRPEFSLFLSAMVLFLCAEFFRRITPLLRGQMPETAVAPVAPAPVEPRLLTKETGNLTMEAGKAFEELNQKLTMLDSEIKQTADPVDDPIWTRWQSELKGWYARVLDASKGGRLSQDEVNQLLTHYQETSTSLQREEPEPRPKPVTRRVRTPRRRGKKKDS